MSDMNKVYDLLEKVYIELQDTKKEVKGNSQRLDKLENGQKKLEILIESEAKTKLQALHEREAVNSSIFEEHSKQLTEVNNKLDYFALSVNSQDKRLEIVESSRRKRAK